MGSCATSAMICVSSLHQHTRTSEINCSTALAMHKMIHLLNFMSDFVDVDAEIGGRD